ncbi:9176_t:CDS:2, partial [Cetraspora pellucida]
GFWYLIHFPIMALNSQSENSQNENSLEPISKKSTRQPIAEVWSFFNKGVSVKDKDVIDFYNKVVANRQGHSQAVFQEIVLSANLNKKKCMLTNNQASLSEFLESTKLTPQCKDNINSALIKAFIVCNISFHIISNPYFIDVLREL